MLPRITFTDATIRALKPAGKQETYWCNLTPNFARRMSHNGGKSFFVMLGRERKPIHLGTYPHSSMRVRRRERCLSIQLHAPTARGLLKRLNDNLMRLSSRAMLGKTDEPQSSYRLSDLSSVACSEALCSRAYFAIDTA